MKRLYIYYIIGVTLAVLTACSSDSETAGADGLVPISFSATLNEAVLTRADATLHEDNAFKNGETMGVYGHSSSGLLALAPGGNTSGPNQNVEDSTDIYPW